MKFSICYIIRIALVLIAIALALWVKDVREDEFAPDLPELIEEESVEIDEEPDFMYSSTGLFTVPYEQFPTPIEAFEYAREMLGDSASKGYKQWYLWRGGMFNTENGQSQ